MATYNGNTPTSDAFGKFRVLIADEQRRSREALTRLLKVDDSIEEVSTCSSNGNAAVAAIEKHEPDMMFIHVRLPEIAAFKVVESTSYRIPAVVYMSAFDRYAARAFDADAADYIVKPCQDERLLRAIERAKLRVEMNRRRMSPLSGRMSSSRSAAAAAVPKYLQRLKVRNGGRSYLYRVELVDFFSAAANYVLAHCGSETHQMRSSMGALEANLDPAQFVRIHRSTIINIDRLKHFYSLRDGTYAIALLDGTEVTTSRNYLQHFKRIFLARE